MTVEFDSILGTKFCDAIEKRIELEFLYDDDPHFICHPHVLYFSPEQVLFLEGFRPGGGFRDYDVGRIRDLIVTDRHFEPDLSINLDNPKYGQVFCSIYDV